MAAIPPPTVGALPPNWFDIDFGDTLAGTDARKTLAMIANSPKVIEALQKALDDFDAPPMRVGPSRTQVIRRVLSEVLVEA